MSGSNAPRRPAPVRLERQAVVAGRAVRAGKPVRDVSTGDAEVARAPGNERGEALPDALRTRLEGAFGADLRLLRVHHGAAARPVLASAHARALTTGHHVWLAPEAWQPASLDTLELMAHEVTHVLQQVGVARESGLALAPRSGGSGPAQASPLSDSPNNPNSEALFDAHVAASPADAVAMEAARAEWNAPGFDRDAWLAARDTEVQSASGLGGSVAWRSLVLDLLKLGGWTATAALLVELEYLGAGSGRTGLRTQTYRGAVPDVLLADVGWIVGAWALSGAFGDLGVGLQDFQHAWTSWVLSSTRAIPGIPEGTGDFQARAQAAMDARLSGGWLPDDLALAALFYVRELDGWRISRMAALARDVDEDPAFRREPGMFRRAEVARRWSEELGRANAPGRSRLAAQTRGLLEVLVPPLQTHLAELVEQVNVLRPLDGSLESLSTLEISGTPVAEALTAFSVTRRGRAFVSWLNTTVVATLARSATGEQLDTATFSTRVTEARRTGDRVALERLDAPMVSLFRGARGTTAQPAYAATWAALKIARLDASALTPYLESTPNVDLQRYTRLQIAGWLAPIAGAVGANTALAAANAALSGTEAGRSQGEAILVGEWEETSTGRDDAQGDYSKLLSDMDDAAEIEGLAPFRTIDLARWLHDRYVTELQGQIVEELRHRSSSDLVVNAAAARVDARIAAGRWVPPRRYTLKPALILADADDPRTWTTLLAEHPKTRRLLLEKGITEWVAGKGLVSTDGDRTRIDREAVFWSLPSLDELTSTLQSQEGIHAHLAAWLAAHPPAAGSPDADLLRARTETELSELSFASWAAVLRAILRVDPGVLSDIQRGQFREDVRVQMEGGDFYLTRGLRRATAEDRHNQVRAQLAEVLRMCVESGSMDQVPTPLGMRSGMFLGTTAAQLINRLSRVVLPASDLQEHTAILLLDVATELEAAIRGRADRFDTGLWLGLLQTSLATLTTLDARPKEERDQFLTEAEARTGSLAAARPTLEGLGALLTTRLQDWQFQFGFSAFAAIPEHADGGVGEAERDPRIFADRLGGEGARFAHDGVAWTLLQVQQDFTFFPKHRVPGRPAGSTSGDSRLFNGHDRTGQEIPVASRGDRVLVVVQRGDETKQIRERDEELLEELAWAVQMGVIVRGLEDLAVALETGAQVGMEVAELVPGEGQLVMAMRITMVIQAFLNGEMDALLDLVRRDPWTAVEQLVTAFDVPNLAMQLLETFLFAEESESVFLSTLERIGTEPRQGSQARHFQGRSAGARLAVILQRLVGIGRNVARSFDRFGDRTRAVTGRVELGIARHRVLAAFLRLIVDNIALLTTLAHGAGSAVDQVLGLAGSDPQTALAQVRTALGERIQELVDGFVGLQIPSELVPVDDVVVLVLDIVASRLGLKFKAGWEAVKLVLQGAGKWDEVEAEIKAAIGGAGLDPNVELWQPFVHDTLDPLVDGPDGIRMSLLGALRDVLDQVSFLGLPPINLHGAGLAEGTEFATPGEAEVSAASPSPLPGQAPAPVKVEVPEGGEPLPEPVREEARHHYGSSFQAVRVHRGTGVDQTLARAHASALTAGSHVLLGSHLEPASDEGRQVMRHELAHVLQDDGAEQSVDPGSATVRWDPGVESAADRMAERPGSEVEGRGHGWAPTIDFAARLLERLARVSGTPEELPNRAPATNWTGRPRWITRLPNALGDLFGRLRAADVDAPFDRAVGSLKGYLSGAERLEELRGVTENLGRDSLAYRGTKGQPDYAEYVDVSRFKTLTERWYYHTLGVLVDIQLKLGTDGQPNGNDPVRAVKIQWVHLPLVPRRFALWADLLTNTFSVPGTEQTRRRQLRRWAINYIRGSGGEYGLYRTDRYAFTNTVKQEIEDLVTKENAAGGSILPTEVPEGANYVLTSPTATGQIGLRVGTYRQLTNPLGKERNAHHVPQYLLAQYFHNGQGAQPEESPNRMAFKLLRSNANPYPGLVASSGRPVRFTGAGDPIEIADFEAGRGDLMPAISISSDAHEQNTRRLHVTPESDDLPSAKGGAPRTPAIIANERYTGFLRTRAAWLADAEQSASDAGNPGALTAAIGARSDEAKAAIGGAMRDTYRWMYRLTRAGLETTLTTLEADYYRELCDNHGRTTAQYNLPAGLASGVLTAVDTANADTLGTRGWGPAR